MEFGRATTDEELLAIQRLRYDVYVQEKGWFKETADHDQRRLVDPEDATGWHFFARDAGVIVGALRMTWGGDGFTHHQVAMYGLEGLLAEVPAELMAIGERVILRPEFRGTPVAGELMVSLEACQAEHGVRIVFGGCEPHLLNLYISMGQRPYSQHNVNSDIVGFVIPLVAFVPDGQPPEGHPALDRLLAARSRVTSAALVGADAFTEFVDSEVRRLAGLDHNPFEGMTREEAGRCTARSSIIECDAGDILLKQGGEARNAFVLLEGTLEARDGDRTVCHLSAGDLFGELAFLLDRPRALDVVVTSSSARVLSLSSSTLDRILAKDPDVASTLMVNISRMLGARLATAINA